MFWVSKGATQRGVSHRVHSGGYLCLPNYIKDITESGMARRGSSGFKTSSIAYTSPVMRNFSPGLRLVVWQLTALIMSVYVYHS